MNKDFVNQQAREYIRLSETIGREERLSLLVNLIEKFLILDQGKILFTKESLSQITSSAKARVAQESFPLMLSNSEVGYGEVGTYMIALCTVDFLRTRHALKKEVEIETK